MCSSSSSDYLPASGVTSREADCPRETPAGAECEAIRAVGGCLGQRCHHLQSVALHTRFCVVTLRVLCATCLPGIVGGVANSAPQLLSLSFGAGEALGQGGGWAQRASVGCEWSSSRPWLRGSKAAHKCLCFREVHCGSFPDLSCTLVLQARRSDGMD